jgi:hypothetical protein
MLAIWLLLLILNALDYTLLLPAGLLEIARSPPSAGFCSAPA